ncbi:DUF3617 family protein [Alcanivorax sp. IO_7]|nr:DUF3617 family protein [Alcanivorax sp. IO_7]
MSSPANGRSNKDGRRAGAAGHGQGKDQDALRDRQGSGRHRKTLRQNWLRNGCDSPETDWDGDTLEWRTQCQAGERTLDSSGTMTVEDEEHYTTEITTGTAQGQVTIKAEARWAGPCDS